MVEQDFITKYKQQEFKITVVKHKDTFNYVIFVLGGLPLEEEEEMLFWTLYPQMETIKSKSNKDWDVVKLTNDRSLWNSMSS